MEKAMLNRSCLLAIACGGVLAGQAAAQVPDIEQRMREEMQLVMMRMIEGGAFAGTAPDAIAFTLDEPAQRVTNLGLLVDSASAERAQDGLHVLAVSPKSTAQRMGVRAGDVITAVNGVSLVARGADDRGRALAATELRDRVDAIEDGGNLAFAVVRNGKSMQVDGTVASITLPPIHLAIGRDELLAAQGSSSRRSRRDAPPAEAGCGRLNVFDVAPHQQKLYGVKLLSVDGELPGPTGTVSFRVPAGEHTLEIAEQIDPEQLSFNSRQRYGNTTKTLTIHVAADTTYYLAAKLNVDQRTRWAGGAYWDPVVWKDVAESCR
jgi:hypothetical protein